MQKLFIIVLLAINLTWATTQDSTVTVVSSYTGISTKVITPSNTMADIGYILGGNIHAKIDSLPPFTVSTQGISTSVNQLVDQYYLLIISHLDSLIQAKLASGDTTGNYYRLQLLNKSINDTTGNYARSSAITNQILGNGAIPLYANQFASRKQVDSLSSIIQSIKIDNDSLNAVNGRMKTDLGNMQAITSASAYMIDTSKFYLNATTPAFIYQCPFVPTILYATIFDSLGNSLTDSLQGLMYDMNKGWYAGSWQNLIDLSTGKYLVPGDGVTAKYVPTKDYDVSLIKFFYANYSLTNRSVYCRIKAIRIQ